VAENLGELSQVKGLVTAEVPTLVYLQQQPEIRVGADAKVIELYTEMLFSGLLAQTIFQWEVMLGIEGLSTPMVFAQLGGMWPLASLLACVGSSGAVRVANEAPFGNFFAFLVHSDRSLMLEAMPYCTLRRTRSDRVEAELEEDFVRTIVVTLEGALVVGCEISGVEGFVRYGLAYSLREQANCLAVPAMGELGDIDNLGIVGLREVHLDTFLFARSRSFLPVRTFLGL
jgi:hypothetical protein